MKFVYLSIQSTNPGNILDAAETVSREENITIDAHCMKSYELDDDVLKYHEFEEYCRNADFILIRCMTEPSRFKRFDRLEELLRKNNKNTFVFAGTPDVRILYRDLFSGTDGEYKTLTEYMAFRGKENDQGMLTWIAGNICGENVRVRSPVVQRTNGLYHPDFDDNVTLEEYLPRLKTDIPTVGFMFNESAWLYGNTGYADALIRKVESEGMNIIPVFFSINTNSARGEQSTEDICRKYFMDGDKSRINALLMNTPFSQLFNSKRTSGMKTDDKDNFYRFLTNVPAIQVAGVTDWSDYETSAEGLAKHELLLSVAWPEVDGQIISVPISYESNPRGIGDTVVLEERLDHLIRLTKGWATLSKTPVKDRRIAILMYQSRPDSGTIGGAASLDVPESICGILSKLKEGGYTVESVPNNSHEIIDLIMDNLTNDLSYSSDSTILEKAADMIDMERYGKHYDAIPEFNKKLMEKDWGAAPGETNVINGKLVIPGIVNGNIYIGYQPLRGRADNMESMYHDPTLSNTHQYLAFYRWLKYDFKAQAIVHMGTHGTLEWLPGKATALSEKCFPDLILDAVPHLYPYVIDNPGEGLQAKRRSEAVLIGHLNATMARSGHYDELSAVDLPLQEYMKIRHNISGERKERLLKEIYDAMTGLGLHDDLKFDPEEGPEGIDAHVGEIHDYLSDVKDALIRDGLHILGNAPSGNRMDETVYSLTRLRNGSVPSFRDTLGTCMGADMTYAADNPSEISENGKLYSEILDEVDDLMQNLLSAFGESGYDYEKCHALLSEKTAVNDELDTVLKYICDVLVPNLDKTKEELSNLLGGFEGQYVMPGPSGAPTRGNADILPMGRNYYGLDPDTIPTRTSWEIGKKMANQMIEAYTAEKGTYPDQVGFIIWATDTMKTNGDDVGYILWLMGVRPVWSKYGGQVVGLEVVPLEELGRPRVDVVVRITGLFRDTCPNLIDLIDDAVKLVCDLDEDDKDNHILANLRKDIIEGMADGLTEDEAMKRGSARIFGSPPGAYGAGVNHAIEEGNWETVEDLADIYIAWGSAAYGRGMHGESMKKEFVKRFGNVKATIKNMPDREIDLLDVDDVYAYLGGMNAFMKAYGKEKQPLSFIGDGSNPDKVKIRDAAEECKFVFRSKALNPKFIEGLKEHGYAGAGTLSSLTEYVFGWDATSDIVEDWMYTQLTEKYVMDKDTRDWMMDVNPHALMDIINRLQEAIQRGMWDASPEMRNKLKDMFLLTEERIEEVTDRG